MFGFGKKGQGARRREVRRILVEQLEGRKLMASDVMPSVMAASYLVFGGAADNSREIVDSFTVDTSNLPIRTVVGSAVDLSGWLRSSAFGETVEGTAEESFEVIDSYTVDPENLPEGTVIGETVMPTDAAPIEVASGTAVDLSGCCVRQPLVKR